MKMKDPLKVREWVDGWTHRWLVIMADDARSKVYTVQYNVWEHVENIRQAVQGPKFSLHTSVD